MTKSGDKAPEGPPSKRLESHLIGTMFDTTRIVERLLTTGTLVRLRVEDIDASTVIVHEALRRRGNGPWVRWTEFEGEQSRELLRLGDNS